MSQRERILFVAGLAFLAVGTRLILHAGVGVWGILCLPYGAAFGLLDALVVRRSRRANEPGRGEGATEERNP
jgi:hypothetical protein